MKLNVWKRIKELEEKIAALEENTHEPQEYKKKCDEMEKRIKALESKTRMFR